MKYLLLLMENGEMPAWSDHTPEEQADVMRRFGEFDEACKAREGVEILAGEALGDSSTATVVRTRNGVVELTDGPYAEAVEGMGGFYLLEAPHLDVVLDLVRILPPYDMQVSPAVDPG